MSDPAELICEALVSFVVDLPLSLQAEVVKVEDPLGYLKYEQQTLQVLFHVLSETAEKIGRGGQCLETYTISMLVIRKLDAVYTRNRLAAFTRELKAAIRGERMASYVWTSDETTAKFDPQQQHELHQFCSLSQFTYSGTG
jgi:hypothetical protein